MQAVFASGISNYFLLDERKPVTTSTSTKQMDDAGKGDAIPSGQSPTLYKVNPDKSVTPATSGYTSSSNQLTTSGK